MWANGRLVAGVAGAALIFTLLAGHPASTATTGQAPAIGYVDLQLVSDEIKQTEAWKESVARAMKTREELQQQLRDMSQLRYLSEEEKQELQNLEAQQRTSEQEQARIAELRGKSEKVEEEWRQLAVLVNPTDEQKQRVAQLAALREQATKQLEGVQLQMQERISQEEARVLSEAQERVLKVVTEVAQQENIQIVLDRDAILVGGRDLTDAVVTRIKSGS